MIVENTKDDAAVRVMRIAGRLRELFVRWRSVDDSRGRVRPSGERKDALPGAVTRSVGLFAVVRAGASEDWRSSNQILDCPGRAGRV